MSKTKKPAAYVAAERGTNILREVVREGNSYLKKTNKPYRLEANGPYAYTISVDSRTRVNVSPKSLGGLRSALVRRIDGIENVWNKSIARPDYLPFAA